MLPLFGSAWLFFYAWASTLSAGKVYSAGQDKILDKNAAWSQKKETRLGINNTCRSRWCSHSAACYGVFLVLIVSNSCSEVTLHRLVILATSQDLSPVPHLNVVFRQDMEVLLFTVTYWKQKQSCSRLVGTVIFPKRSENELHWHAPNSEVALLPLGSVQ